MRLGDGRSATLSPGQTHRLGDRISKTQKLAAMCTVACFMVKVAMQCSEGNHFYKCFVFV